jgi:hypothetical protein
MENAINTYLAASTEAEARAAYAAMLEWSDAPEGSEADDVDNMLNQRGLPSLAQRLTAVLA